MRGMPPLSDLLALLDTLLSAAGLLLALRPPRPRGSDHDSDASVPPA
jgi:hypothetical protein